jgi:phage tail sheath protein FI
VLSYAALFHPWIVVRETTGRPDLATAAQPPDGAVCGVIAARTLKNGAWYSAANQVLIGALAVSPPLADVRLRLLDLRVNPIVQQPRGFVAMDALTLHPGDEFGELHVRRLLILLRRLALREGTAFVFRSNDNALRRLAERLFEQVLGDLFVRGAFAGARHEEGYVVVADDTVNTPQSRDAGRFIVELRVAPSHPLMFLTVRLVQEGGAWQATEEP